MWLYLTLFVIFISSYCFSTLSQVFIKKMFMKYGDGESLTVTGFEELMKALKLDKLFNKTDGKGYIV